MTNVVAEAPASGSSETSVKTEGAADGGCASADKAQASGEGVSIYADVHRTNKNGEGYKITYTTDGVVFENTDKPEDIPAGRGDRVFVDTIPIAHTDGFLKLLDRGVEVYYLRRLTLLKKRREELKLSKTARGDIKALMSLEERWFRKVSEDFLVMRRMICMYRTMLRTHIQYVNRYKAVSENERNELKPVIEALEEQMNRMASKIAVEAGSRYPAYNRLVKELNIDSPAVEALAEIITYIDPDKGFVKTANYFGLFKGRPKIYNKHLRQALQRLTASVNNIPSFQLTARLEKQTLEKIWKVCRQETRGRLAIPAQG